MMYVFFILLKYSYFPFVFVSNFNSVNFNCELIYNCGKGEWKGRVGRASAVGRASDVAVEWEGLVLTWHGKGEWEGRRRRHP